MPKIFAMYDPHGTVVTGDCDGRVFEIRTYTAHEGRLDALHARFRNHTVGLFKRHGMTNVGYWTAVNGENADRTLIYLMAYPSQEAREASWKAFGADPDWQKVVKESQADGVRLAEKVVLHDPSNGRELHIEVQSSKILSARGEPTAIVSVLHDLTPLVDNERLALALAEALDPAIIRLPNVTR